MEKIFNLIPVNQGSFYGKAKVIEKEDGSILLKSYDTIVCGFTPDEETGEIVFKRFWSGYSVTTMKHVNDFVEQYKNMTCQVLTGGKKWWLSLPCESEKQLYKITISNGFYNHVSPSLFTYDEAIKEQERLENMYQGRAYIDIIEV